MRVNKYNCIAALPLMISVSAQAADIEISGAMEVEAGFHSDYNNVKSSDITLATVELAIDSQINDRVSGHLSLIHEEDDTPLEVDEGTISLDMGNGWNISAGQMYIPFGNYESNMISDPLTLQIGETRESALQLGFERDGYYSAVYIFNGDSIETSTALKGEDTIENFGVSIGKSFENDKFTLNFGLDYISSIGDTDGIFGNLTAATDHDADAATADISTLQSYVSGFAFHWIYNRDALSFIAEHVKSDSFQAAELAFKGQGAAPSATNIELGYAFEWGTAAIGYQTTEEALSLALPETRILFSISHEIFENTTLGYEHSMDEDYSSADGGTGKDGSTSTLQLAVAF